MWERETSLYKLTRPVRFFASRTIWYIRLSLLGRIDQVSLNAVDQLDPRLGGGGVRFGKSLDHAVVGDGYGRMSPLGRELDQLAHVNGAVQGAHLGVQMEFDPLFFGVVHPRVRRGYPHAIAGDHRQLVGERDQTGCLPRSRTQSPTGGFSKGAAFALPHLDGDGVGADPSRQR